MTRSKWVSWLLWTWNNAMILCNHVLQILLSLATPEYLLLPKRRFPTIMAIV